MVIALFSSVLLAAANPSIEVIEQYHLGTPEGRAEFLTEKLTPFVVEADRLNREITAMSQEVTEKMAVMSEMLPALNMALRAGEDFEQIDEILQSEGPLTPEQQEIADRIATLCQTID